MLNTRRPSEAFTQYDFPRTCRLRKNFRHEFPPGKGGGGAFAGIRLLLCENPLSPLDEAIEAAQAEVPFSNYYTQAYSEPLRRLICEKMGVSDRFVHLNAGSELILRQLFERFGRQAHFLSPTYSLFPEIAGNFTETLLHPEKDFAFELERLEVPPDTDLVAIVNPNNPTGGAFDMKPLPDLLKRDPEIRFLVDEAFIGMGGDTVAPLVPSHQNLMVTGTFSKTESLAGFRVGYAVLPEDVARDMNTRNDAYPLTRPSQAAAIATLRHEGKIRERIEMLQGWTNELAAALRGLGIRTYPTRTYFFLADFSPHDAGDLAQRLRSRDILIKPLNDLRLGAGFMRVTTSLPENNARFIDVLKELL